MNEVDAAGKILKTMLGHLGFEVDLEVTENSDGPCLNIVSPESHILIGKGGDRLEDIQYLTNRILIKHFPKAPRVKVDSEHFRANQEQQLLDDARKLAEEVLESGTPKKMPPLNAYYRRLVYNVLSEIDGIKASSAKGKKRYKRIVVEKSS